MNAGDLDPSRSSHSGDGVTSAEQGVRVEEVDGKKVIRFAVPAAMQGHTFEMSLTPDASAAFEVDDHQSSYKIVYVLGSDFVTYESGASSVSPEEGYSHIAFTPHLAKLEARLTYSTDKSPADVRKARMTFRGDEVLQRVVIEIGPTDFLSAVKHSGLMVADILDALALLRRIPISVRHIEVERLGSGSHTRYVTMPYGTRDIAADDLRKAASTPRALRGPLRLYREGLSSNKPHYRLLCLYCVREALTPIQEHHNQIIIAYGGTPDRPARRLADSALTRNYFPDYVGKKVGAFLDHVRNDFRLPIAHGGMDEFLKLVLDPADARVDHRVDYTNAALLPVIGDMISDEMDLVARHALNGP